MSEALEKAIQEAQEAVTKQGDTVRSLKASLKDGKAEKVLRLFVKTERHILLTSWSHLMIAQSSGTSDRVAYS